ncbi:hypothetical protein PARC_a2570 [Pseudoalteromonas arctica A 37-1-2]|uniref:Uncharacterized protein n=1 Tax=Pseudoalteromonas arctica A 37-1-2 TaxID=1117313 RepID=A0A290S4M1_9GAMM|nr:hypothetical protein PARC_a2570 [Pseudoalteromonas arctica A 37-1-2]
MFFAYLNLYKLLFLIKNNFYFIALHSLLSNYAIIAAIV